MATTTSSSSSLVLRNEQIEQLQKERQAWQQRIAVQQHTVQQLQQVWQEEVEAVGGAVAQLRIYKEQTQQMRTATQREAETCHRLALHLEAQRIRLVKELRRIYPISTSSTASSSSSTTTATPTIRGLALPSAQREHLFALPEEELSAALGFASHAVLLLSRYLSVPLRYRLYCNSSRSAVQDDRGTVYPLFQARPVEREQVEYAVLLLERNVECIGRQARGIVWENEKGVPLTLLHKINLIYHRVIEGDDGVP